MKLLLDLGNTRLKWGTTAAAGSLGETHAHDWDKALVGILQRAWEGMSQPRAVWAASVVDPGREAQVAKAVMAYCGLPVNWVRTPREACGVRNAYAEPETLGVDRFLAMVAARDHAREPCILVHVGTTMVLDMLNGWGQHQGGLIAPGPRLMRQSVSGATVRVRPQSAGCLVNVAANTADAVVSGCWHACAALVDRFVARMASDDKPQLLLSGGDAEALIPLLEHAAVLFPNATLNGLAVWAGLESNSNVDGCRQHAACSGS